MWTIIVGTPDDQDDQLEVMVANQISTWGTLLHEDDPLYSDLITAADAIIKRCNEERGRK